MAHTAARLVGASEQELYVSSQLLRQAELRRATVDDMTPAPPHMHYATKNPASLVYQVMQDLYYQQDPD